MAGFREYAQYDGLGLAALVRQGDVSPAELVAAAFDAIERLNPELNAVIHTMEAHAEAVLREGPADGPFHGVPFLAKDLMISYAGIPTGGACRLTDGFTRDYDSDLVTRFKASGIVTIGKTNTPELGMNASAEPVLTGPTHNPWKLGLVGRRLQRRLRLRPWRPESCRWPMPMTAGVQPVFPATCCHLDGPQADPRGRNPAGPDYGEIWGGLVSEHIVSRSVRDTAVMLDCTAGPSVGDPYLGAAARAAVSRGSGARSGAAAHRGHRCRR